MPKKLQTFNNLIKFHINSNSFAFSVLIIKKKIINVRENFPQLTTIDENIS